MRSNSSPLDPEELHALSGAELLDRTGDLVSAMNSMAAELSRTVRVAGSKRAFAADGQKTAQSWLRGHCRLSRPAAAVGEVLARFAVDRPHDDLTRLVHQVLQRIDQDGPEPDPRTSGS